MKKKYEYILGDSRVESARLRRQAALWDPTTFALFDRLKMRRGMRVLEVGPGQGSLHLELRRRVRGAVDAVERSQPFVARLATLTKRDGFGAGTIWGCDLLDAPLPANHYDIVFARWVFLFLPDVPAHLAKIARALKPGGRLVVQDYLRDTLAMSPRPESWDRFMEADRAFFATQGGDVNIGARLPRLVGAAGLALESVTPTVKIARPRDAAWRWMSDYFLGVMDRYAGSGAFTKEDAAALEAHWRTAARDRTSIVIAPALLDVVARKRR